MEQAIHHIESVIDTVISNINACSSESVGCDKDIDRIKSNMMAYECRGRRCIDPLWEEDRAILLEEALEDHQNNKTQLDCRIQEHYDEGIELLNAVEEAIERARLELDEAWNNA